MSLKKTAEPMTEQIRVRSNVHKYWTNFNSKEPDVKFSVVPDPGLDWQPDPGWWRFLTNIPHECFEYEWDPMRVRRFLFTMDDIYNRKQHTT